ncbi:hypothetical protein K3495_g9996 [Podosphaera aphanis]|nr:hypothetical protein K3495_g9996 [Podosphaera aphanis]
MATDYPSAKDLETQQVFISSIHSGTENAPHVPTTGVLGQLQRGEAWLDRKLGIETQGADRIREEDKQPPSVLNMFLMWWSLTCHVGALPVGMLGPEFGLTLSESIAGMIIGTSLGAVCAAFCGTLGPKLGLRAMATARYSFGFYGVKFCSLLNVIIGMGFATVNVVVVGQLLSAVTDYKMSIAVGCIIIGAVSYIVSLFGFKLIHSFEKYAWIGSFILFCILLGQTWSLADPSAPATVTGLAHTGAFLSYVALNFSCSSSWSTVISDYFCNYPASTAAWKMWLLPICGITFPTCFTFLVGAVLSNIIFQTSTDINGLVTHVHPTFLHAYEEHGLGGILRIAYYPRGFSTFVLVLLVFSVIGNNVAVNYSSGLSMQLLGNGFRAVPRFFWSFLNALIITILAVAGRENLSMIVSNFVSVLGYWTVSFNAILFMEDKVFRRRSGYDLDVWDVPSKLPWGIAAMVALLVSYIAGGLVGMAQAWYIGPIAKKFGGNGGDVGIYLAGLFTLIVYLPGRWYERKIFGK